MAFPRMNNLSFWMYVAGLALGVASMLSPGGNDQLGSGVGWVLYPPLSVNEGGMSMDLAIFAVHVSGASSILGAINMITTFLNMRAPGMTLFKVPLFAWSIFITAWLILLALPVLAGAITMLLTDRNFGTTFFDPQAAAIRSFTSTFSGSSVTQKSISWFFQALASSQHIFATFSRKPVFGYLPMVWALIAIGASRLRRLGTPHVHCGHVSDTAKLLHACHHDDCDPNRDQDLLMDRNNVGRQP